MKDKKFLLIVFILVIVVFVAGCSDKKVEKNKYDYLVLVNKYSKLPDDWEDKVELVSAKDAWDEDIQLEKETYEKYKELKKALEKDGVTILLDSVYRSVEEQQKLWDDWTVEKGIDYVKKYVAVPGYSEHHTGLAVDICLKKDGELVYENDDMIADRETFAKIHKKLADYGFILRYLENRDDTTGYAYEPWHLRYIGSKKIAKEIMEKDITLEEYLGSVEDIKETPSAAKYQIEKTLQKYFNDVYGDKIINSRFNVKKIYSSSDEKKDDTISSLKLGKRDVAFEVEYQLQPADGADILELTAVDGEYDESLGWVKNINRLGILKYDSKNDNYSITHFGTGW